MREIKLTQGQVALVDDEDYERVNQFKWSARKSGNTFYVIRNIRVNGKRKTQLMHVFIMGDNPLKLDIDHIFGDGLNNQKCNLRFCTASQNAMNAKIRKNCSSIYKGVCFHKALQKWMAYIQINGKLTHLGLFKMEIDAARAYDIAVKIHYGEFAHPNFP